MSTIRKWFRLFSSVTLILVGAAKVAEAMQAIPILDSADPVFLISNRKLLMLVAVCEFSVALLLYRQGDSNVSFIALFWLSGCFLVYHFGRALVGAAEPCICLGALMGWIGLTPVAIQRVTIAVALTFFLMSSIILMVHSSRKDMLLHRDSKQ